MQVPSLELQDVTDLKRTLFLKSLFVNLSSLTSTDRVVIVNSAFLLTYPAMNSVAALVITSSVVKALVLRTPKCYKQKYEIQKKTQEH